jgi:dephospho-CoA kinase
MDYMKKIIGITGNMGTGKSTLAKELAKACPLHIIELDDLRRYALWESTESHHIELRKNLAELFQLELKDTWMDRELFTDILFASSKNLKNYSAIATPILYQDTQIKIKSQDSNTLVVWAWLLEEGYTQFLNSFVILTYCKTERLTQALSDTNLTQRRSLEPSYESRLAFAKDIEIFEFDNSDDMNMQLVQNLVSKINE